jgi:hypothetical protein
LQAALVNTITEGARKGHWAFKEESYKIEHVSQVVPTKDEKATKAVEAKK